MAPNFIKIVKALTMYNRDLETWLISMESNSLASVASQPVAGVPPPQEAIAVNLFFKYIQL